MTRKSGQVSAFDLHEGLGHIDTGGTQYLFHCAELVDGTRDVAVGARVTFSPVVRFGRNEAVQIVKE